MGRETSELRCGEEKLQDAWKELQAGARRSHGGNCTGPDYDGAGPGRGLDVREVSGSWMDLQLRGGMK